MPLTHAEWALVRRTVRLSIRSGLHCAIASRDPDGSAHLTPIGSVILTDLGQGFHFDIFNPTRGSLDRRGRPAPPEHTGGDHTVPSCCGALVAHPGRPAAVEPPSARARPAHHHGHAAVRRPDDQRCEPDGDHQPRRAQPIRLLTSSRAALSIAAVGSSRPFRPQTPSATGRQSGPAGPSAVGPARPREVAGGALPVAARAGERVARRSRRGPAGGHRRDRTAPRGRPGGGAEEGQGAAWLGRRGQHHRQRRGHRAPVQPGRQRARAPRRGRAGHAADLPGP